MWKIFYHKSDLDGKCCGAIARRYCEENNIKYKFCPIEYGDVFPYEKLNKNDTIIMMDYAPQPYSKIFKIHNIVKNLIWIDHHTEAIKEYNKISKQKNIQIKGRLNEDIKWAACTLAWEYFFPNIKIPLTVKLIGAYDTWQHVHKTLDDKKFPYNLILPFQYGLKNKKNEPTSSIWDPIFDDGYYIIIIIKSEGENILKYINQANKYLVEEFAYEIKWEGLLWLCINNATKGSSQFESKFNRTRHDATMVYQRIPNKKWKVHLYTDKQNIKSLGKIAKKYGGGGHKQAAGFMCNELPFNY
ncbi:MAG: hypothetical protein ACOCRK_07720 [bacterium]